MDKSEKRNIVESEKIISKNDFTRGIFLIGIPFLGYLSAFSFEVGYTSHFGIPISLINIDISTTLKALLPTVIVFFLFNNMALPIIGEYLNSEKLQPKYKLLFGLLMLDMMLIGFIWPPHDPFIVVMFLFFNLFVICSVILSIFPNKYLNKKSKNTKLVAFEKLASTPFLSTLKMTEKYPELFSIVATALIVGLLSYITGSINASHDINFTVSDKFPKKILLRSYGDRLIFADFDDKTKLVNQPIYRRLSIK